MNINDLLLKELYNIITPEKIKKFETIAADRTRYLTVAVENIYQEQNASAVIRSCDCFGIQDIYIIEKNNQFSVNNDIAMGAGQWINHYHYTDPLFLTTNCINHLKSKGYKIVATTPHTDSYTVHSIPLEQPLALFFGTEHTGLSEKVIEMADYRMLIPMVGFTESINISASAAITMSTLRQRLSEQKTIQWKLSKAEQTKLKINWCKNIIRNPEIVIKDLLRRIQESNKR